MIKVKAKNLCLGDILHLGDYSYSYATVKKIEDHYVVLYRPYVHHDRFVHTGGITCYVGIEEFRIYRGDVEYDVIYRGDVEYDVIERRLCE